MDESRKKDLAQILIEGTKAVYGKEKADQVQVEFEKLEKPHYRQNAEGLTVVVERVCNPPEVLEAEVVENIDDLVKYESKPSKLKVAVKGTLNLINKTCWYYPLVGALPARYQEKTAEKLGGTANYCTMTNGIVDLLVGLGVGSYSALQQATAGWYITLLGASIYGASGAIRALNAKEESRGSLLLTIPFKIVEVIKDYYALELQEGEEVKRKQIH